MKQIDFTQVGGYRLKQPTFSRMQESYFEILSAFIKHLKVPDIGSYIISGCEISGANITDGILYIDGDLCPFVETAGTLTTKIKKVETIETLAFESGSNLPVFRTTTAQTSLTEGIALENFTRIITVQDSNYVHTDNNFTTELLNKLTAIQNGAQVNVKPDWNAPTTAPNGILNRPNQLINLYTSGAQFVGDVFGNQIITVLIQNVPNNNYDVLVSFYDDHIDGGTYTYAITEKNQNYFKIRVRELGNWVQNLKIEYYIIAKN